MTQENFTELSQRWFEQSVRERYSYRFSWLGRPIIQYPQDLMALQEIIWKTQPQLIVETGIAHGGSLIFHASMLELLGGGEVLGIDVDIRAHNRSAIEQHPLSRRIQMLEGSSIDDAIVEQVFAKAGGKERVLVILDSLHTHEHVYRELQRYSPLVKKDSYLVVLDTVIEDLPDELSVERPWHQGDNPKTAVWQFLEENPRFEVDRELEQKLQFTVAPDGYLKCLGNP